MFQAFTAPVVVRSLDTTIFAADGTRFVRGELGTFAYGPDGSVTFMGRDYDTRARDTVRFDLDMEPV